MLKEKRIIPSFCGGIKSFEHFQRGEYFSDCAFRLICELISPYLKPACILLLVVTVTFSYMARFITFAEQALSFCSVKEPYCMQVNKLVGLKLSQKYKTSKLTREESTTSIISVLLK